MNIAIIDNNEEDLERFRLIVYELSNTFVVDTYHSVSSYIKSPKNYSFLLLGIESKHEDGIYLSKVCLKKRNTLFILHIEKNSCKMLFPKML